MKKMSREISVKAHPRKGTKGVKSHSRNIQVGKKKVPHQTKSKNNFLEAEELGKKLREIVVKEVMKDIPPGCTQKDIDRLVELEIDPNSRFEADMDYYRHSLDFYKKELQWHEREKKRLKDYPYSLEALEKKKPKPPIDTHSHTIYLKNWRASNAYNWAIIHVYPVSKTYDIEIRDEVTHGYDTMTGTASRRLYQKKRTNKLGLIIKNVKKRVVKDA
jgi:hypothetical protein